MTFMQLSTKLKLLGFENLLGTNGSGKCNSRKAQYGNLRRGEARDDRMRRCALASLGCPR
jgi:hypothetical protein